MTSTLEVRWFLPHAPFDPGLYFGTDEPPLTRTDWYAFPCDARTGVKIREGRLEAKLMLESLGGRDFPNASGVVERWQKWSVELPPGETPSELQLDSAGWVGVRKERFVRFFEVNGSSPTEVEQYPDSGAQFEWTRLYSGDQVWWTTGFEACGPESQLERNLALVVETLLGKLPSGSGLHRDNSFGYPKWLGELASL